MRTICFGGSTQVIASPNFLQQNGLTCSLRLPSIKEFANLQGITGVDRMPAGAFGDINFVVNNVNNQAEMKVATLISMAAPLGEKERTAAFAAPHPLAWIDLSDPLLAFASVRDSRCVHGLLQKAQNIFGLKLLCLQHNLAYNNLNLKSYRHQENLVP
jgi:hypothetical protein